MNDAKAIFTGNNVEEVAEEFAEIVGRNYLEHLEFCKCTACDDRDEFLYWEERIQTELECVKENAYTKVLEILQEPQKNRRFLKKKGLLTRHKKLFSITRSSGFYDDLLPEEKVKYAAAVNVEYLINKETFCIEKKIYPQGVEL